MPPDPYSQNSNTTYNQYTSNGYEKAKLRKLVFIVVGILVAIAIIASLVHISQSHSPQNKYTQSATAAARKQIPDAKATNVKVARGFAIALVIDPSANSQARAGNTTIFKVSPDGSMTQLANGSSFSPLDLLNLGIPLTTQAQLIGSNLGQVKQNLAAICGYSGGNTPGYNGFDGSFSPGGWEIDAGTQSNIEQVLSAAIVNQNTKTTPSKAVICVSATRKNSNTTTDPNTYFSTYTLELQFITNDGTLTTHTFTYVVGSYNQLSYTLDGKNIQ